MAYRVLSVVLIVLALTNCGRKGELETPSAAAAKATATVPSNDPGAPPPADPKPKPDKPFILDPLI